MSGYSPILLNGRVAIVTGAGSPVGIGRSTVFALAAAGAKAVYAVYNRTNAVPTLVKEVADAGFKTNIHAVQMDVSDEARTLEVMREILAAYGRLDIFVANAARTSRKDLSDTNLSHYDQIMNNNARPFFLALRYGGQAMANVSVDKKEPGGSIISVSSLAAHTGGYTDLSYAASKQICSGLVKSGSFRLASTGVRVNAISPGLVRTSIVKGGTLTEEQSAQGMLYSREDAEVMFDQALKPLIAKYRHSEEVASPEAMADIIVFLASDNSRFVNGQDIVADKGQLLASMSFTGRSPVMPPLSKM